MTYAAVGRRIQGKSTLGYYITRKNRRARIIIAPKNDLRPRDAAIVSRSADVLPALAELRQDDRRFSEVVIHPHDLRSCFIRCTHALDMWRAHDSFASFTLMLDEWKIIERALKPGDLDALERLMRTTKVDRQHIVFTFHRPKDIPADFRALIDSWLVFRVTETIDVRALADVSERLAKRARRLGPREYVYLDARRDLDDDPANPNPETFTRSDAWHVCLRCGSKVENARCLCEPGALPQPAPEPLELTTDDELI